MRPPPLLMMQLCNVLGCSGGFLTAMMSTTLWTSRGWTPWQIGLGMTIANSCYAGFVAIGGRLADRIGRARTCMIGGGIGLIGNCVAFTFPHPLTALAAAMFGFAGLALYFPGSAGLMSEGEGSDGKPALSLHRKVSIYNIGWALGALSGFAGLGLLSSLPIEVGFGMATCEFLLIVALLTPWRNFASSTTAPSDDRSDHPALSRLTFMSRLALLVGSALGMGMIAVLERCLSYGQPLEARGFASMTLTAYACGYVGMFVFLGRWSGWILRPWRLWIFAVGFLLGGAAFMLIEPFGFMNRWSLALAGLMIGLAFGAVYTSSIYYSLRLPHGVSRAAGLHETFIGIGNTTGPIVAGLTVDAIRSFSHGSVSVMSAFSWFIIIFAIACLGIQATMIPGTIRYGAK